MSDQLVGRAGTDLELEFRLPDNTLAAEAPQRRRLGRSFLWLWVATAASNLSDGLRTASLPLLGATLSRDPVAVGGIFLAGQVPWLIFGIPAGALVDRVDRRRLLWGTHAVRSAVVVLLAAAVLLDAVTLPLLYVVSFMLGSAETIFDNAAQSLLPSLVDEPQLEKANGRIEIAFLSGNQFAGPALGATLFAAATAMPFLVDAAALGVAALAVFMIPPPTAQVRVINKTSLREDVREGLSWLWSNRPLRTVSLFAAGVNFSVFAALSVLVLFALEVLRLPPAWYGVLLIAYAAGGVAGGFAAPWLAQRLGRRLAIVASIGAASASFLSVGTTSNVVVASALWVVLAIAATLWNVVTTSMRQTLAPPRLLGRVIGAHRLLSWGGGAMGALAGSLAADAFGLRAPFLGAGMILAVLAVLALRFLNASIELRGPAAATAA